MPEEVAVQEAPAEVSQDKPADSPLETPPILPEDTGVEQVAEAEVEAVAEPEQAPEEPPEDTIKSLPVAVIDQIARERGEESPYFQELLRRREQSVKDSILAEETRRRAQEEDNQRVLVAGQQAIRDINAVVTEVERAAENGETPKVDRPRLLKAITDYTTAWTMGQATRWNSELQEGFVGLEPLVNSLTEEDMGQLTEAVKTSNKQGTRTPTVKAMFTLAHQKGFQGGYEAAIHDLVENDKRQKAVEAKKDGLLKLKENTPTTAPSGIPTQTSSDQERLDRLAAGTATEQDKNWYRSRYGKYA